MFDKFSPKHKQSPIQIFGNPNILITGNKNHKSEDTHQNLREMIDKNKLK